jgi:hypothetical protein
LPPAVRDHAPTEAEDATIRGCVKDKENGEVIYKVKTSKNRRSRDIVLRISGSLIEVEQEVTPGSVPVAVADAIAEAAQCGKVGKVESVLRGGAVASYETTITRQGRRLEAAFSPQGVGVNAE